MGGVIAETEGETHSWVPVDLLATAAARPEPPTISGLADPARRHVFSGEPETLKTWAALILCVEEIRKGENVLWADFETGRAEMLERLRDLGLTDSEIESSFIYMEPTGPLAEGAIRADVEALIEGWRPLVVIDAFTGALEIHGCDPNSGTEIARSFRTVIQTFRAWGGAVVILDHVPKNRDARGKFSIGSERKIGAQTYIFRLRLLDRSEAEAAWPR
jgi:hypothetical protein